MTRMFIVPVHGEPHEIDVFGLSGMQRAVGGYIETIPWLFDDAPAAYCNEEGKFNGLEPNRVLLYDGKVADIAFGDLLFAGVSGSGDTVDITDAEIEKVMARFGGMYPYSPEGEGSGFAECLRIVGRGRK